MKKKVKMIVVLLIVGIILSSCGIFGERKKCPAYTKANKIEKISDCKEI